MKPCNAVHYFKRALLESQIEIEEIKFKTREDGHRFARAIEEEIEAPRITPVVNSETDLPHIIGITLTWPKE